MTGQIVALPDADGNGVADTILVAVENLWWANNLQFYQGDLYVGDRNAVGLVRLAGLGTGTPPQVVADLSPLAGPRALPLAALDDSTYQLDYELASAACTCTGWRRRRGGLKRANWSCCASRRPY